MMLDLTPDQEAFQQSIQTFVRECLVPQAGGIDRTGRTPVELLHNAASCRVSAILVGRAWGGSGRDWLDAVLALESIARASAGFGMRLAAHNLAAAVLARAGREGQKALWLHRLASIETMATVVPQGEGNDPRGLIATMMRGEVRLVGCAEWVPCGDSARVALVSAHRPDADHPLVCLVDLEAPGVDRQQPGGGLVIQGAGWQHLMFGDTRVPVEHVLATGEDAARLTAWMTDRARLVGAAVALGVGRSALDEAIAHARAHTTPDDQVVRFTLADMATEFDAARLLVLKAASQPADASADVSASMAKLAASDAAQRAAEQTMRMLASAGIRHGDTAERLVRDALGALNYPDPPQAVRKTIAAEILPPR